MPKPGEDATPIQPEQLATEDFYYEGPYVVFTREYHLKRGFCCNSGCRHCPYGDAEEDLTSPTAPEA